MADPLLLRALRSPTKDPRRTGGIWKVFASGYCTAWLLSCRILIPGKKLVGLFPMSVLVLVRRDPARRIYAANRGAGRASVPASPDFHRMSEQFGLAGRSPSQMRTCPPSSARSPVRNPHGKTWISCWASSKERADRDRPAQIQCAIQSQGAYLAGTRPVANGASGGSLAKTVVGVVGRLEFYGQ
jgi:hypothetical protein